MPMFRRPGLLLVGCLIVLSLRFSAALSATALDQSPETAASQAVRGSGTPYDPPPIDSVITYYFSGVTDNANAATVVHCTNTHSQGLFMWLQVYNDNLTDSYEIAEKLLTPGQTYSFSTSTQSFFSVPQANRLNTGFITQGVGRIAADDRAPEKILCTAQVVQKNTLTPSFLVNLDLFGPR